MKIDTLISKPTDYSNLIQERGSPILPKSELHTVKSVVAIDDMFEPELLVKLDNDILFLFDWSDGLMYPGQEVLLTHRKEKECFYLRFKEHPDVSFTLYKVSDTFYQISWRETNFIPPITS
jgi:hypothetical protein